jgi:hypothetical protein
MPTYRDPNGRLWHVPDSKPASSRRDRAASKQASSRARARADELAGLPIPDRETLERELAEWAKRFAEVIITPVEIVRDVVRMVGGAPTAAAIAATLYYVTREEHRRRGRR